MWVSGGYGGVDLEEWRTRAVRNPIELEGVREHLLPATWKTWGDACEAAGTTAEALARAVGELE